VIGDEEWIYFENPKRKRSWVTPANHRHRLQGQIGWSQIWMEDNALWWDQKGVIYYELLKPEKR